MSDLQALEARLREDPDDWGNWLVYADWLSDRGDVRSEIIALDHRISKAPRAERKALVRERDALFDANKAAWAPPAHPDVVEYGWRSGFITSVKLKWRASVRATLTEMLAWPSMSLLSSLDLSREFLGDAGAHILAEILPATPALKRLYLGTTGIGSDGVRALARPEVLGRLLALDLRRNDLGNRGANALAQSPASRRPKTEPPSFPLRLLHLSSNNIGDTGAVALARAGCFRSLRVLVLSSNRIGDTGAIELATANSLPSLVRLELEDNRMTQRGYRVLEGYERRGT